MGFAGDPVAHLAVLDGAAHGHDVAGGLVAQGHRGLDALLGPVVPLQDVEVGAADGGAVDLDKDLVIADLGDRQVRVVDQASRPVNLLDNTAHRLFHVGLPLSLYSKIRKLRSMLPAFFSW